MYGVYGFHYSDIFLLIGIAITMLASFGLRTTYARYRSIRSGSGMRGVDVAYKILQENGLYDVRVEPVAGNLTDHYNPADKTVNLSEEIYNSTSIAAVSVAAHECGHAIQHGNEYVPLRLRSALVPLANIGSRFSWPLIFGGILLGASSGRMMIQIGIFLFLLAVLFQIATLPVEFDASRRAIAQLQSRNILPPDEVKGAKKVLGAAALTYVAGAAAGALQLMRLILITRGRRRD